MLGLGNRLGVHVFLQMTWTRTRKNTEGPVLSKGLQGLHISKGAAFTVDD